MVQQTNMGMTLLSTFADRDAVLDPRLVDVVHVETGVAVWLHSKTGRVRGAIVVEGKAAVTAPLGTTLILG
jgi:hypothetical protein